MKKNFDLPVKIKLGDDNIPFVEIEYTALYQHNLKEFILRGAKEVDGILFIEVDEDKKSNPQLGYYFGVVRQCARQGYTNSGWMNMTDDIADLMLREHCSSESVTNPDSGEFKKIPFDIRAAKLSEMITYIDTCVMFISEIFGIDVPPPDKNYKTKL